MKAFEASPKISVLMPVYNGERYLQEAVESILAQTFTDLELIIVDDGSTDHTSEILTRFQDPRVRLVRNENNQGIVKSRNIGLKAARGEYIACMDADDVSLPRRFAKQVEFLDSHPEVGVMGTGVLVMDSSGLRTLRRQIITEHQVMRWGLCFFTPIMHSTVMMRRKVAEEAGGYRQEMVLAEDYDLWRRLSDVTRLANLPDELVFLRRHNTNVTRLRALEMPRYASQVSQKMMSRILNEEVPIRTIQPLWERNVRTPSEARPLADLVYRLYTAMVSNGELSNTERLVIRQDAAMRLSSLSRPWVYGVGGWAWKTMARALYLDPLVGVRIAKKRKRRNGKLRILDVSEGKELTFG